MPKDSFPMASSKPSVDISSGVSKLSLKTSTPALKGTKSQKTKNAAPVAESWEDEDISSASEAGDDLSDHEPYRGRGTPGSGSSQTGTAAPPPTPMSPTYGARMPFPPAAVNATGFDSPSFGTDAGNSSMASAATKRPEKTDAVARRMIASALGVKVPKQTEEQKAYDRAMREKERRRREEERERERKREEEAARAKQAVWDD